MANNNASGEFYPLDIGTCCFCSNYKHINMRVGGEDRACGNKNAPYYKPPKEGRGSEGTYLEWWVELLGCELFEFCGEKIPSYMFKSVPRDSRLRTVPLDHIVSDLQCPSDVSPYITMDELISAINETSVYQAKEENPLVEIKFRNGILIGRNRSTNEVLFEFFGDKIRTSPE